MSLITRDQVRESVAVARSHGEKFFEQIVWQVQNETWTILGYESWDDMRKAEYAGLGVVAPRADRPELVAKLREHGLTQQEIADTVGASQKQVSRDLNSQMTNEDSAEPEAVINARGQKRPARYQRREPEPLSGPVHDADTGLAERPEPTYPTEATDTTRPDTTEDDTSVTTDTTTLNDFLSRDSEVTLARKRAALSKDILRSGEVLLWKPEEVLEIADPELLDSIRRFGESAARWASTIAGSANTLRVINGGGR